LHLDFSAMFFVAFILAVLVSVQCMFAITAFAARRIGADSHHSDAMNVILGASISAASLVLSVAFTPLAFVALISFVALKTTL